MVDKRVPDLTAIDGATLASADLLHVVDVSDTTDHASGTSKKLTYTELAAKILGGTAATATALATARNINGVSFNGTADITITVAGSALTGTSLASGIVTSSLTSLGTLSSLAVTGTSVFTSASATAFVIGANGATNPVFNVDASVASVDSGVSIKGNTSANGVQVIATGSGANVALNLDSKGVSSVAMRVGGNATVTASNTQVAFQTSLRSSTGNSAYLFNSITGSSLTAGTEVHYVHFNINSTQTHSSNTAISLLRTFRITVPTYAFASATGTITNAAGFAVDGAPVCGTNAAMTNTSTFYSAGNAVGSGATNSWGLNIKANTGATNNYAFRFEGAGGELMTLDTNGKLALLATNTAGGTTGAQTINKPSGTVNFAAAATSLVVTNSLCTTSSIIMAVVRTNDSTAAIKNVVPGAGSFTINLSAAATAETSVGFLIIN